MLTFSCDLILPNVLVTFRAFYVLVTDLETTLSIIDHKLTYWLLCEQQIYGVWGQNTEGIEQYKSKYVNRIYF